jgi:hypothetical protein
MQLIEHSARCELACVNSGCSACREYWDKHAKLHDALKLMPWQWPAYSNFENDDAKAIARYHALKAASDAAGKPIEHRRFRPT